MSSKKTSTNNVARKVKEDLYRAKMQGIVKEMKMTEAQAKWAHGHATKTRASISAIDQKTINEELIMANKELLARRRAEMKILYATEYQEWQRDLNARGLSLLRYRD